jgi:hypothetical protein
MRGRTAKTRAVITVTGLMLLLGACSGADISRSSIDSGAQDESADAAARAGGLDSTSEGSVAGVPKPLSEQPLVAPPLAREVIAIADVTIRVDDVSAALPDLLHAANSAGGYVAGEDTTSDPDDPSKTRSTVVLRVPTASLQNVVDEVSSLGDVVRAQQDVQDVTEQVVDVESRVKSAQASVSRIRVLLDQANTLGEVVRIESQLAQREADLESLLATQRSLADQTALATLTVTALGPEAIAPPASDEEGFVAGLERGWNAFVDVLVVALTVIGLLLPFAVAAALVLVPVWLVWRRRQSQFRTVIGGSELDLPQDEGVAVH